MSLLEKYNGMVPRYTSYPPANFFTTDFDENSQRQLIQLDVARGKHSVALYIHIPFCKKICHYCGCNTCGLGSGRQVEPYLEALRSEIDMVAKAMPEGICASEIHYGGGTPNILTYSQLIELNEYALKAFPASEKMEIAIECNPAYLNFEYVNALINDGFNRFSLGIQDFDNHILQLVNRDASEIPVDVLVKHLQSKGVSVNLDFIYGLPAQTPESFVQTIEKAINIHPDRLVTFSYAHVPWLKKNQTQLDESLLPTAEHKIEMFENAKTLLLKAGYCQLGMDHFVLPTDTLYKAFAEGRLHRNFEGYCETGDSVYAFGSSAISQLDGGFVQNVKSVTDYINIVNSGKMPIERGLITTHQQRCIGKVIEQLMCNYQIDWKQLAMHTNIEIDDLLAACSDSNPDKFADMIADGLVEFNGKNLVVTEIGKMFVRNIASRFDPLMGTEGKRFSTTA